jgi:hypothetical protein
MPPHYRGVWSASVVRPAEWGRSIHQKAVGLEPSLSPQLSADGHRLSNDDKRSVKKAGQRSVDQR